MLGVFDGVVWGRESLASGSTASTIVSEGKLL